MKVFAIGDLHLSHTGAKPMDVFGAHWRGHPQRIAENWAGSVSGEDLVLVPGDLSWAMRLQEADEDLSWLDRLPGRKVIVKGNHDYWWPSISRLRQRLQGTSIVALQYDSVTMGEVAVGGTRLWNVPDMAEGLPPDPLEQVPAPEGTTEACRDGSSSGEPVPGSKAQDEKIFRREMQRLEMSLSSMDPQARVRIAMTHYPPTNQWGVETVVTRLLAKHGADVCVFGHLHNLQLPGGKTWDFRRNGVRYVLTSCDAVRFAPYLILETPGPTRPPST
ncbi:MAG: metallophosphoesterase [bacterium]